MVRKAVDSLGRAMSALTAAVAIAGVVSLGSIATQVETRTAAQTTPSGGAVLRTVWGEPDLMGVWQGEKRGARPGQDTFNLAQLERLYRPEARAKMKELSAMGDPALRCVPQSFPRAAVLGWPIQILQSPGMVFVFNEAFHTHRWMPTDGRRLFTEDQLFPTWLGESTGHWDGETLVVNMISFNGEAWLAGGQDKPTNTSTGVWPTSSSLHVVERWRRVDADTLEYQARVEDPELLTGAWETPTVVLRRQPVSHVKEVKCVMDNTDVTPNPATYLEQFGR